MELSTRSRYAVEAVIDLALETCNKSSVSLSDISYRNSISVSYLEQLFSKLRKAGIVDSIKGSKGGYKLNKKESDITILDIVLAVDEPLETRSCKGKLENGLGCSVKRGKCKSHDLWEGFLENIKNYLSNITLSDVLQK